MSTAIDLTREVRMTQVRSIFSDPRSEVVKRGRWVTVPGLAAYYSGYRESGVPTGGLLFGCPGCGEITTTQFERRDGGPAWTWDGNLDNPTLRPSILHAPAKGGCGWHGYLVEGWFQLTPTPRAR